MREDSDDAQPPPSTPLYAKPTRSRIRLRTTSGGGDEDDDEYVPPGSVVRLPAAEEPPAPEATAAPAAPAAPAPEVLSASSSGTKLKFTIRMSSSAVPAEEPSAELPRAGESASVPTAEQPPENGQITGPPPPMEEAVLSVEPPAEEAPSVEEAPLSEEWNPGAAQEAAPEEAEPVVGMGPAAEDDDAPVPPIRLRMSFSGLEVDNSQN